MSGSAVRIVELGETMDGRWEAYAAAHPEAGPFQHPAWLRALRTAYGYERVVLGCERADGQLAGILPLLGRRGWLTGRRLVSLPHTPVAGPLADGPAERAALVRAAIDRATARGARLEIKVESSEPQAPLPGLQDVRWSTSYVLELPGDPQELRFGSPRNHRRIRWAVNKAEREGVRVRAAERDDDLHAWYRLYLETMRRHVVPPRPYRFFAALWEVLRPVGAFRLLLAEQHAPGGTRLIAGSVMLGFGRTAVYAFNGRRADALASRPNDLIQWRAIHDACADGYGRYDFGEVEEDQHGLAGFKSKWGAEPVELRRWLCPPKPQAPARQAGGRRWRAWSAAAWQRVPVPATAPVASWVYRRL